MVDYCYVLCRKAASVVGDDLDKLKSRAFDLNLPRDTAIVMALSPGPKILENHDEFASFDAPLPPTFRAAASRLYLKAFREEVGVNVTFRLPDGGEVGAHIEWLLTHSDYFQNPEVQKHVVDLWNRNRIPTDASSSSSHDSDAWAPFDGASEANLRSFLTMVYGGRDFERNLLVLLWLLRTTGEFEKGMKGLVLKQLETVLSSFRDPAALLECGDLVGVLPAEDGRLVVKMMAAGAGLTEDVARTLVSFAQLTAALSGLQG